MEIIKHTPIFEVPELAHDKEMLEVWNQKVSVNGRLERRIVANLIAHLKANGFVVHSVYDGFDEVEVATSKEAMELIFNLDEASLRFGPASNKDAWHGVLLIMGNGIDIISDWNYQKDDNDSFNVIMENFDSEHYA